MLGNFLLFVDRPFHLDAWEYVASNPGQSCNYNEEYYESFSGTITDNNLPQEESLVFRQKLGELHPMDGVEEDHLLLARLHRARLHRNRQLDDRLDGAKAKLVVGLLAQHCRADLKH